MRRIGGLAGAVAGLLLLGGVATVLLGHPGARRAAASPHVAASLSVLAAARPFPSGSATLAPTTTPQPIAVALPAAAAGQPAAAAARLSIPRIGIRGAPIYDRGTDSKGMMAIAPGYAVTHYAFSAAFGSGNAVLYGHDDIQGSIFGRLYDLAAGDLIEVAVGGQTQTYRVTGHQIVAPTAVSVLAPTADARLTIITCWPFNVDTKRWIVTAVKA